MKNLIFLLLVLIQYTSFAQDNCKVLTKGIDSLYIGSCKKGLADGLGEAWGKNHYTGNFKKGYPHGLGSMEYADGSMYVGAWRNGKREGKGNYSFRKGDKDTTIVANWENDKISQKVIANIDYKILREQTPERLKVYRSADGNRVHYKIFNYGTSNVSNVFISGTSGIEFSYSNDIGFNNINFPFIAKIRYETWNAVMTQRIQIEVEVEIIKPGEWFIDIR
jgi:hypothetical protein